jgi:hypothetical protein
MKRHLHSLDLRQSERAEIPEASAVRGRRQEAPGDAGRALGSPRFRPPQPSNGPLLEIARALPVEGDDVLAGHPRVGNVKNTVSTTG